MSKHTCASTTVTCAGDLPILSATLVIYLRVAGPVGAVDGPPSKGRWETRGGGRWSVFPRTRQLP